MQTYVKRQHEFSGMSSVGIDSPASLLAGTTSATNFPHGASFGSGAAAMFAPNSMPAVRAGIFHADTWSRVSVAGLDSATTYISRGRRFSGFPPQPEHSAAPLRDQLPRFVGNAIQCADGFVTKLSPRRWTLLYSTFSAASNETPSQTSA